eukprot:scaffold748_cov329-Pavlova_lutheri.AAC.8
MVPIDDANSVRVISPSTFVASVNHKVNRPTYALLDKTNVPSSHIVEIPTRRRYFRSFTLPVDEAPPIAIARLCIQQDIGEACLVVFSSRKKATDALATKVASGHAMVVGDEASSGTLTM